MFNEKNNNWNRELGMKRTILTKSTFYRQIYKRSKKKQKNVKKKMPN